MQRKCFPLSRVASLFRYRSWPIPPSEVEVLKTSRYIHILALVVVEVYVYS